jgi:hypothetical protein
MNKIDEWTNTFEANLRAIRSKIKIYFNELNEYELMIPSDRFRHKDRIIELRSMIDYYEDIISKYEDESIKLQDEILGDVYISGEIKSNEVVETEFGDFPVVYNKSKEELIDEYYEVIQNLNQLKRTDKSNLNTYKELAEQYYFKYALLIERAPFVREGVIQNDSLSVEKEDYQLYVNQYNLLKRLVINLDEKIEELNSRVHLLENQYMNFSNRNSIEKNEIKVEIADIKCDIAAMKAEKNKYEMLSEQALIKLQTAKGVIKKDYCAYLIAKLDADDRVNRELSNIEVFKYEIEKNDAELRLDALSDSSDEVKRQQLLKTGASLEKMREEAFADLSKARKKRLKQEILHAYNVGSIAQEEKENRLRQLESYIVINEAVEKEVSLYLTEDSSTPNVEGSVKR